MHSTCVCVGRTILFSKEELETSTMQFDVKLLVGTRAYRAVYMGQNLRGSGTTVAVKVLNEVVLHVVYILRCSLVSKLHALFGY